VIHTLFRRGVDDDGSAALETAILAPPMLVFLFMAIFAMRFEVAAGAVESAAHDAARAASISRTAAAAHAAATTTAYSSLDRQGLRCSSLSLTVNTSEFSRPVGTPANVYVSIECVVALGDIAAPGIPGSRTVTATFVSPLDRYRGRQ
jgi:Flp pilus assembly protein TadG